MDPQMFCTLLFRCSARCAAHHSRQAAQLLRSAMAFQAAYIRLRTCNVRHGARHAGRVVGSELQRLVSFVSAECGRLSNLRT